MSGGGLTREGDATAYLDVARQVLGLAARDTARGLPLGIATQRSSFALWERGSGKIVTPLISWQDRRPADWCRRHGGLAPEIARRTGLVLSPHYVGPKLAWLRCAHPELGRDLDTGRLVFGTLDTLLGWTESGGRCHDTDLTVAARTLLVELGSPGWSDSLLELFDVPRPALPSIGPSLRREGTPLRSGATLAATISDQAAAMLAVLDPARSEVLVNLGTGGFVLAPCAEPARQVPGYLCSPVLWRGSERRYALEGTINGAGAAVDRFGPGPTRLTEIDPSPQAFALPDVAGLGSPHWRPDLGLVLSAAADLLPAADRRRIVIEGLIFRIREILEDLVPQAPVRVVLTGGLSRERGLASGLAAALARPIEVAEEPHSGLAAAARLAAGRSPYGASAGVAIAPGPDGAYLAGKYSAWRRWAATLLAGGPA